MKGNVMPGMIIRVTPLNSPKELLNVALFNSWILVVVIFVLGAILNASSVQIAMLAGCVYLLYMLNEHRRIFVLHRAPSFRGLIDGYLGTEETFWKFVEETGTTLSELEEAFWFRFFILPLVTLLAYLFLLL